MKLFESRKEKLVKNITLLFPLFLLLCVVFVFFIAIGCTSDATIQKEQSALLQTLENGAVRTYALKGQYPESLDELLSDYHIIAAERAYGRGGVAVAYDLAAAGLAYV